MNETRARQIAIEVESLLANSASAAYFGEPVSQLAHALQCAQLARDANADNEMILAALLHDIGHLIEAGSRTRHPDVGVIDHDAAGVAWLAQHGFQSRLVSLVGSHVNAKRFLVATNPNYARRLSDASRQTLALQGGPMIRTECEAFSAQPYFQDALRLRSWDELAKQPGRAVTALAEYGPLLIAHLASGS